MLIKYIVDEDIAQYKKICMTIGFPKCSFKCGEKFCQNSPIVKMKDIEISYAAIVKRYLNNPLSEAICFQGLEPFDSPHDLFLLIEEFRKYTNDNIVIYTGYDQSEIPTYISMLYNYKNIIIKFGRYIPNQEPHFDKILGINLASNNQYAEKIS